MADKPKRKRRTRAQLIADGYYDNKDKPKAKTKRKRRTRAQLLADGYYDNQQQETKEKITEVEGQVIETRQSLGKMLSVEEFCEQQLQRAKDKNLPQPDFDYRSLFSKGQNIYYVETNELCGTKKMLELKITNVYPRVIIAFEDQGMAHTIGYEDVDLIFTKRSECEECYKTLRVDNKMEEFRQRQKQLENKRRLEREKK